MSIVPFWETLFHSSAVLYGSCDWSNELEYKIENLLFQSIGISSKDPIKTSCLTASGWISRPITDSLLIEAILDLPNPSIIGKIEVNPFLHFLSKNKSINFIKNLEITKNKFLEDKIIDLDIFEIPKLSISKKLFRNQLNEILKIKKWVSYIQDKKTRDLFFCIFLCSLDKASYAKKDGNGLKYPKNKKPENFYNVFNENLEKFIDDIKNVTILNK